jgi:hypothetical protein
MPLFRRPLIGLALCCVLHAADSAPKASPAPPALGDKVEVSDTVRSDFPSGGTLHLKNSVGELNIEGWDETGLEITTIKSTKIAVSGAERDRAVKLLDRVKIATDRKGDEVTVSTSFPKHSRLARPFEGMTDFDLEYRIKIPRNAKLTVEHAQGEVHIDDIRGEIHAVDERGLITVRVPDGHYAIDARSKLGSVNCDFTGSEKTQRWLGHTFLAGAPADSQKIFLRVNFGDIIVIKMNQPPAPVAPLGK